MCGKQYIWNPATCNYENGKYLGGIIDHSVVICDETLAAVSKLYNNVKQTVCNSVLQIALQPIFIF